MGASAIRGAVLVALAVVLGFLILRGITDREQVPITSGSFTAQATPTPTPDPAATTTDPGAVTITSPTAIDTSTARPNAEVQVLVANGTDVSGQAGRLTDVLRNQGFNTRPAVNGSPPAFGTSIIYYRPGFAAEAEVVRQRLGTSTPVAPMPVPDPSAGDNVDLGVVDVFVWIGPDSLSTS